jgi:hypothetical protein
MRASYERRFWAQVDKRGPDECWPWTGYVAPHGYGLYGGQVAGRSRLVHRIAYQFLVGPIPDGLVLDHLCHTRDPQCADTNRCPHRRCVNPAHADPCTRGENVARGRGGDSWGYEPDPIPVKPEQLTLPFCPCGSPKPIYKSGMCRPCYRKWLKDPDVERPSQRTPEQRFWMKVDKHGPIPVNCPELGPCWVWTASLNQTTGYGQFFPRHGHPMDAHRFSYLLAHSSIPEKHDVHHVCLVRRCVRPAHLVATTRSQNLAERMNRRSA